MFVYIYNHNMFKIGKIQINGQLISAPQAGVSNIAWRELMKENGADLVYTEMISIEGLAHNSKRTLEMMEVSEKEHPISIQIFGRDLNSFVEAAKYVDKNSDADIIDINVGCPVEKVAKRAKAGSALLKDIDDLRLIIRSIVKNISKPLTIKIRVGWDSENLNYLDVAKMAEEEGVSAIAVHARTREQMYSGKANWDYIKEIKNAVNIPVIGNGDVKTPEDAKRMLEQTGCDAVMIARGLHGNPWLFNQTKEYLKTGKYYMPNDEEKIKMLLYHTEKLINLKGEKIALKEMRMFISHYLKGMKNNKNITSNLSNINSLEDLKSEIKNNIFFD